MPFYPASGSDFLKAMVIVYWPLTGFEISAIPADEIRTNQGRNILINSMKIVMAIVVFVYLLVNISLIVSMGSKTLSDSPAPIAAASALIFRDSEIIVASFTIVAMLSALNVYIVGTSRVLQDISSIVGLKKLAELGSTGTPIAAIVFSGLTACILLILFSSKFQDLAIASVITTLFPYILICLSALKILDTKSKTRIIAGTGMLSTSAILITYFLFLF